MDLSKTDINYLYENHPYELYPGDLIILNLYKNIEFNESTSVNKNEIYRLRNELAQNNSEFKEMSYAIESIIEDFQYFPVAASINNIGFVEYIDSWGYERNYGGNRTHEGCDLMAIENIEGLYPIISVCDGTITNIGWLEKGGYRVGIESCNGIYYYYAHLSEYANIKLGDEVKAGDLIGFMGNSGYGPEGTTGMFDVHLHFGIYYNDVSINPYWFLLLNNNKLLYFDYDL